MNTIHGFSLPTIYAQAHLGELGFTLEQLTRAPMATLTAAGQMDAILIMRTGFRPLRPKQIALRRQWDAKWAAEGNPAEPHPRSRCATLPRSGLDAPTRACVLEA